MCVWSVHGSETVLWQQREGWLNKHKPHPCQFSFPRRDWLINMHSGKLPHPFAGQTLLLFSLQSPSEVAAVEVAVVTWCTGALRCGLVPGPAPAPPLQSRGSLKGLKDLCHSNKILRESVLDLLGSGPKALFWKELTYNTSKTFEASLERASVSLWLRKTNPQQLYFLVVSIEIVCVSGIVVRTGIFFLGPHWVH